MKSCGATARLRTTFATLCFAGLAGACTAPEKTASNGGVGGSDASNQTGASAPVPPLPPRTTETPSATTKDAAPTGADAAAPSTMPDSGTGSADAAGTPTTPPPSTSMPPPGLVELLMDPLTSAMPVEGEDEKKNTEGEFTPNGWRATGVMGQLVVGVAKAQGLEGVLEVEMTNLDWMKDNLVAGALSKMHFINMFSNRLGEHHVEDGGGPDDALWTLRGGAEAGQIRYGNTFQVLWASNGAKRTKGSDYLETLCKDPAGWTWSSTARYTFSIAWSAKIKKWSVSINGQKWCEMPWPNQIKTLKYVFLGRDDDFQSMVGPYFSNLRVYGPAN